MPGPWHRIAVFPVRLCQEGNLLRPFYIGTFLHIRANVDTLSLQLPLVMCVPKICNPQQNRFSYLNLSRERNKRLDQLQTWLCLSPSKKKEIKIILIRVQFFCFPFWKCPCRARIIPLLFLPWQVDACGQQSTQNAWYLAQVSTTTTTTRIFCDVLR